MACSVFDMTQSSRVSLSPDLELSVGGAGPQEIVRPTTVCPQLGRLPQLVTELGGIRLLGLPADDPRPGSEQRLMDDLDPTHGGDLLIVRGRLFERGQ